jgi:hypothetical protein
VIEPPPAPPEEQSPNVATIAILGFLAGLVLWLGGACLVLGAGGSSGPGPSLQPSGGGGGGVSTPRAASPTPGKLADRTNCAEIRGTDYRSDTERQWFLANCS